MIMLLRMSFARTLRFALRSFENYAKNPFETEKNFSVGSFTLS